MNAYEALVNQTIETREKAEKMILDFYKRTQNFPVATYLQKELPEADIKTLERILKEEKMRILYDITALQERLEMLLLDIVTDKKAVPSLEQATEILLSKGVHPTDINEQTAFIRELLHEWNQTDLDSLLECEPCL